jgi:Glyoxalase/Bleomycin resistance protein/Dioxygenase superfamily
VQHINIQIAEIADMTESYQRVKELGFDMTVSVGQHINDLELSYYCRSPSGFEWEVGWNPITVDEATWEPTNHRGISTWGHTLVGQTIVDTFRIFQQSAKSLTTVEDTVAQLSGAGIPNNCCAGT